MGLMLKVTESIEAFTEGETLTEVEPPSPWVTDILVSVPSALLETRIVVRGDPQLVKRIKHVKASARKGFFIFVYLFIKLIDSEVIWVDNGVQAG